MLGDAIRKLRRDRGLSQSDLAAKCGLTSLQICGFESGERKPDLDQLGKIAGTFGVDIAYFLRRKQDVMEMTESELKDCVNDNPQLIFLLRKVVSFSSDKMGTLLSIADVLSKHGSGKINCLFVEEDDWK